MRPPAPIVSMPTSTSTTTSPAAPPPAPATAAAVAASPWHSPVPYLFGGLGAMLGLITLALLILACSYWKLNNYLGTGDAATSSSGPGAATDGDGAKSPADPAAASPATFADLVAVVMAGEKVPTFLAAPIVRRAHGNSATAAATDTGEGSPETEEQQESRGKAGEGESGAVADEAERERQQDQV